MVRTIHITRDVRVVSAGKVEQQSTEIWRHSARRDQVVGEPAATVRGQVVESDTTASLRRVNDSSAADVDRNMINSAIILEHQEIARRDGAPIGAYTFSNASLVARRARKYDAEPREDEADEA